MAPATRRPLRPARLPQRIVVPKTLDTKEGKEGRERQRILAVSGEPKKR